jgi:hypothetical protein
MMRAGRGLCAGQESVLNAVPEGGSAGALTATIGPGTVVRWVPGGPGPCLNFLSAEHPELQRQGADWEEFVRYRSRLFAQEFNSRSYEARVAAIALHDGVGKWLGVCATG